VDPAASLLLVRHELGELDVQRVPEVWTMSAPELNVETFNKLVRVYEDAEDALAMRQALTDLGHFVISHREAIRAMSAAVAQARPVTRWTLVQASEADGEGSYSFGAMEPDADGGYVTFADHARAVAQARADALEEAAKAVEGIVVGAVPSRWITKVASAIRALAHGAPDAG
jgi:hypothetical protein